MANRKPQQQQDWLTQLEEEHDEANRANALRYLASQGVNPADITRSEQKPRQLTVEAPQEKKQGQLSLF